MTRSAFNRCLTLVLLLVVWNPAFLQFSAGPQNAAGGTPGTLRVMTDNLRYAHSTPPNAGRSAGRLCVTHRERSPDVCGNQRGSTDASGPPADWTNGACGRRRGVMELAVPQVVIDHPSRCQVCLPAFWAAAPAELKEAGVPNRQEQTRVRQRLKALRVMAAEF